MVVLLLGFMSSACVLSSLTTGAQVFYQRHSLLKTWKNHYIGIQANHRLFKDKRVFAGCNLSVESFNNDLLLVGQVPKAELKQKAQAMVSTIKGVRHIYNMIEVGPPISSSTQLQDTWITSKIKTQVIGHNEVNPSLFKVVTEDSIVYLMGDVEKSQADIVVAIARHTDGVKKVIRIFKYIRYEKPNYKS